MENNSLNLRNLPKDVTQASIRQFYGKVGKIRDVRIVTNKAVPPNFFAFAFVDFLTAKSCSIALKLDPTPLGPCVLAEYAIKRGFGEQISTKPELPLTKVKSDPCSIVVTGTSPKITRNLISDYFTKFGHVHAVKMTRQQEEIRAFVQFSKESSATAAVSQCDQVIEDNILIFIRPASDADVPLYWYSSVTTRLRSFFNGEEGDEEMLEDLYNLAIRRKVEQEAKRAEEEREKFLRENEEDYHPGDADASRRCRRVFAALSLDCDDDEVPHVEATPRSSVANIKAQNLVDYFSKCEPLPAIEQDHEDEEEWPSCESAEGKKLQSLVCPQTSPLPSLIRGASSSLSASFDSSKSSPSETPRSTSAAFALESASRTDREVTFAPQTDPVGSLHRDSEPGFSKPTRHSLGRGTSLFALISGIGRGRRSY